MGRRRPRRRRPFLASIVHSRPPSSCQFRGRHAPSTFVVPRSAVDTLSRLVVRDCRSLPSGGRDSGPSISCVFAGQSRIAVGRAGRGTRAGMGGTSSARVSRSRAMPVWRPALHCSGTPSGPGGAGRRAALSCLRATLGGRRLAKREKNNGSELCSLPAFSGECVKGGILPFHKKGNDQSELAAARRRRAREFRFRREAPGGPGMGAYRSQSA